MHLSACYKRRSEPRPGTEERLLISYDCGAFSQFPHGEQRRAQSACRLRKGPIVEGFANRRSSVSKLRRN